MQITRAQFVCSSEKVTQVPRDAMRDIAFIGRSNVGKSSLINHFLINGSWYLVDLPGYGYARVSKTQRGDFARIILDYVLKCERMHYLFVLVDSRLEPQKIDLRFIEMLGQNGVPFGIIFTKCDKLSAAQTRATSRHTGVSFRSSGKSCRLCSFRRARRAPDATRSSNI